MVTGASTDMAMSSNTRERIGLEKGVSSKQLQEEEIKKQAASGGRELFWERELEASDSGRKRVGLGKGEISKQLRKCESQHGVKGSLEVHCFNVSWQ